MSDLDEIYEMLMAPLSEAALESLSEFAKLIAYKGFDPAELVEKMHQLQPNKSVLSNDLSILISQFLSIGRKSNEKEKPRKKKKSEIAELKRLTKLYDISRDSSDRNSVTLRRIAIAFAPLTVRILTTNKIQMTFTNAQLSTIAENTLPWCIRTQIYLCTLPAHDNPTITSHKVIFKNVIEATVCYSYLEAKIINKEGRQNKWSYIDYMSHVIKYAVISIKSEHLSQKDCEDVWNETLSSLYEGQSAMEKLVGNVRSELPEFDSMFEKNFGVYVS